MLLSIVIENLSLLHLESQENNLKGIPKEDIPNFIGVQVYQKRSTQLAPPNGGIRLNSLALSSDALQGIIACVFSYRRDNINKEFDIVFDITKIISFSFYIGY